MIKSIFQVSRDRWQKAQDWELKVWQREEKLVTRAIKYLLRKLGRQTTIAGDDWNHWWKEQFDDYRFIPLELENAIELGCGPYTNIRLIREGRQIKYLVCSDPLASQYIHLTRTWVSQEYKKGTITIDNHPIEEIPFAPNQFDLVVLINVLDHVRDAQKCIENAISLVKPHGIFIFGQDLTNDEDMQRAASMKEEDIGHPIRLHHDDLVPIIEAGFTPLINKILQRNEGRAPKAHYGTLVFAGRKSTG